MKKKDLIEKGDEGGEEQVGEVEHAAQVPPRAAIRGEGPVPGAGGAGQRQRLPRHLNEACKKREVEKSDHFEEESVGGRLEFL